MYRKNTDARDENEIFVKDRRRFIIWQS